MEAFSYRDVSVRLDSVDDDAGLIELVKVTGRVSATIEPGAEFRVTKPWMAGLAPSTFERPYVRVEEDIEADPTADGRAVLGLMSTYDGPELVVDLATVLDALLDGTLVPAENRHARYTSF